MPRQTGNFSFLIRTLTSGPKKHAFVTEGPSVETSTQDHVLAATIADGTLYGSVVSLQTERMRRLTLTITAEQEMKASPEAR